MQLGIGLPSFASKPHVIPQDRFRRYARTAEKHGFAGAWLIDHLLKPESYDTSLFDPLVTLSYVAGETDTLPVGTSILVLPLRHPVWVAKRAATLQHLASRQLTLGLGTGYVEAEFDAVDVPYEERSPRYLESIELIYRLLHEDTVTFDGEYFSVEDFHLEPKLGQPPRILAAGEGVDREGGRAVAKTVKRRLLNADGWIAPPRSPDVVRQDWAEFSSFLEAQGTDPNTVEKVLLQYIHFVPGEDSKRIRQQQMQAYNHITGDDYVVDFTENWLSGTQTEILETLESYEQLGFDEVILHPVVDEPGKLDRQLQLFRDHLLPHYQ